MKNFSIFKSVILCFIMCLISVVGFTACGNPRDGMKVNITGVGETEISLVDDKLQTTLTMEYDELSQLTINANATLSVEVTGGADTVSREVTVISSDPSKVTCIQNSFNQKNNKSTIVLQALAPTYVENSVYVDICCAEDSSIFQRLYVNIYLPAIEVNAKGKTGVIDDTGNTSYQGVPAESTVSLDPYQLFDFTPGNATVPNLTYTIGEQVYESLDAIAIPSRADVIDGLIELKVASADDPENTDLQTSVFLRVYDAINPETVNLSREDLVSTQSLPITQLELIKNQTVQGANSAIIQINYESNGIDELEFSFSSEEENVINNILAISETELDNQFLIRGLSSAVDGKKITFSISFKGILNSPVYSTDLTVFIVDYPKSITFNDSQSQDMYTANVYDTYYGTLKGTPIKINLNQFSTGKGKYRLEVVSNAGDKYISGTGVTEYVQISVQGTNQTYTLDEWSTDDGLEFESGQTLLWSLKNSDINGILLIRVVSVATDENDLFTTSLTRNFEVVLGKGITGITLSATSMDQNTNTVYLQMDEYNVHGNFLNKTINYSVTPSTANKADVTVQSLNEDIFTVGPVNPEGNFQIFAVKPGSSKIRMIAGSGYTCEFSLTVLNVMGAMIIDVDVTDQGEIVADSEFSDFELGDETIQTLSSITVSQGNRVSIDLVAYPSNANVVSINATSDNTGLVDVSTQNLNRLLITAYSSGTVNITVDVYYDRLNDAGNALYNNNGEKSKVTLTFEVTVYVPITSFEVSENFTKLLIGTTDSYYDLASCEVTINAIVNPTFSTIKSSSTVWTLLNTNVQNSVVQLNGQNVTSVTGSSITIKTKNMTAQQDTIYVYLIASITDLNQIRTQKITVEINRLVSLSMLNVPGYDDEQGYYFEESKGFSEPDSANIKQSQTIETIVYGSSGKSPTNDNLEYIIFKANPNNNWETTDLTVAEATGKYCETAFLKVNASTGKYEIVPRKAGYAVVYVVPQSILTQVSSSIYSSEILDNMIRTGQPVKKLKVTMSDGSQTSPYRIYDAEDLAAMASEGGINKHFCLMNSIDMSSYFAKLERNNQTWQSIGTVGNPFTGSLKTWDNMGADSNPEQLIISGWVLKAKSDLLSNGGNGSYFGIFGSVGESAVIKNIFFDISTVNYEHIAGEDNPNSYYGVLAGEFKGQLVDVDVTVHSFVIKGTSSQLIYSGLFGRTAMTGPNSYLANVNVNYKDISIVGENGNNMVITFGGISGYNEGRINISNEDLSSSVTINLTAEKLNRLSSSNYFGGVVGLNSIDTANAAQQTQRVIEYVSSSGVLNVPYATSAGGIVGCNYGTIQYCSSSVQIINALDMGGIAGRSKSPNPIYKCSYEIFECENGLPSLYSEGLVDTGISVGGIVGRLMNDASDAGAPTYCMVKSYTDADVIDVSVKGSDIYVGGLIGFIIGTGNINILGSFADLKMFAETTVASTRVGGLVGYFSGQSGNNLTISNSYSKGKIETTGSSLGIRIGQFVSYVNTEVVIQESYSALIAIEQGVQTYRTVGRDGITDDYSSVVVLAEVDGNIDSSLISTTEQDDVYYLKSEQMKGSNLTNYNFMFGGTSPNWIAIDEFENTNDGFPVIAFNRTTEQLYPLIPTAFSFEALEFSILNDSMMINHIQNIPTAKNAIVIMKGVQQVFDISDLFRSIISPSTLTAGNTPVSITSSNSNIVLIQSAIYLDDFKIIVQDTGTVILTVKSPRNNNAVGYLQICVVEAFDDWLLFESEDKNTDNNENSLQNDDYKNLTIKLGETIQTFTKFLINDNVVNEVNGGLAFVVTDPTILEIGGVSYESATYNSIPVYIAYVSGTMLTTMETLVATTSSPMIVLPYLKVLVFEEDNVTSAYHNVLLLDESILLQLEIVIYEGANSTTTTVGGTEQEPNVIEASDEQKFDVIMQTDSPYDKNVGSAVVVEKYDTVSESWVNIYYNQIISNGSTEQDYTKAIVNGDYFEIIFTTPNLTDYGFSQSFSFTLKLDYIRELTVTEKYRARFFSFYTGYDEYPSTKAEVYWNVVPQGVNDLIIHHYSDAEITGNYLINAGEKPTETIIAGEYGLLNIMISPEYAYYDTIEVVSSVAENDAISFDQRVLVETVVDGNREIRYLPYQAGVNLIENGISLVKVSSQNATTGEYSFDGNLWLRTVISSAITTNATFDITVTVKREGQIIKQSVLTVTVDKVVDLSLDFYSYHETYSTAYIAAGTGGSGQSTWNKNELVITTIGDFNSLKVNIAGDDLPKGLSIERTNGKYYVVLSSANALEQLGKSFRIQVVGTKILNGMEKTIRKSLQFNVVNFVLADNLVVENAEDGSYSAVYITGERYDLVVKKDLSRVSYNSIFETAIDAFFNQINGYTNSVNDLRLSWQYVDTTTNPSTIKSTGYYNPRDNMTSPTYLNDSFYIEWIDQNNADYTNGFKIVPKKYGSVETLILYVPFMYDENGSLYFYRGDEDSFVRSTQISLTFIQRSSLENPTPIYNESQLLMMEPNQHYILMKDLSFVNTTWTPIKTAIASLDGNGRSINIGLLNTTNITNFGLFDTIAPGSVIKNLTVVYQKISANDLDLSEVSSFNFGGLASINNGIINNCVVKRLNNDNSAFTINNNAGATNSNTHNIAGFVATNDGDISNSRVENFSITVGWGNLAGFVVTNESDATISSSYYAGMGSINSARGTLRNNGDIPRGGSEIDSDLLTTSGFVGFNNGSIYTSYVGGAFTSLDENQNIVLATNDDGSTLANSLSRDARIYCNYFASGFVYQNSGDIADCYSGLYINCGNDCCGFVYDNTVSGTVARCYSVSLLSQSSSSKTPFIGTTDMGTGQTKVNNANTDSNAFNSCFFYDFGCPDSVLKNEVAKPLTIAQFINQDGNELSAWQNYSVSRMSDSADGQEFTGVWTFVQNNNAYFNTANFNKNLGPQLVSANVISQVDPNAGSLNAGYLMQNLDLNNSKYDEETGKMIYSYNYSMSNEVSVVSTGSNGKSATYFTPFIITSAKQLNMLLVNNNNGDNPNIASTYNSSWFRLATDIDLSEIREGSEGLLNTITTNFAGNFDGNGHTISGLEIVSESQSGEAGGVNTQNIGLVATVFSRNNSLGTFKNLNIELDDISASLIPNVGTLAGTANNAYLFNLSVTGNDVLVTGRNNVGGLVGKFIGTSRANNLTASVNVRSVYGAPNSSQDVASGLIYNADLLRMFETQTMVDGLPVNCTYEDISGMVNSDSVVAYAGGLFGIIDIQPYEGCLNIDSFALNSSLVANLKAEGAVYVIGSTAGGVSGLIGASTVLNFGKKEVVNNSYINSSRYSGGLIGENHGYIRYSEVYYEDKIQNEVNSARIGEVVASSQINFFRGSSIAVGGLVGLNYGMTLDDIQTGNIYCSNTRIRVVNTSASIIGGVVGAGIGGSSTASFATGTVKGSQGAYVGGFYGSVTTLETAIDVDLKLLSDPFGNSGISGETFDDETKSNLLQQSALATYSIANNNWAAEDFNYYNNLTVYKGYIGGFAGYVSNNGDALSTVHTSYIPEEGMPDVAPTPIAYSSETNFFVNVIYNQVINRGEVASNDQEINIAGATSFELFAVGNISKVDNEEIDFAKGLNRHYMQSSDGQNRMYGNWAKYSYSRDENGNFVYDGYGSVVFDRDTVPDVIEISTISDIRTVLMWELDASYILLNDINCEGQSFMIGQLDTPFTGTLDGAGYTIYNFTLNTNVASAGFFSYTKNAYIHDLNFFNIQIDAQRSILGESQVGVVAGKAIDTTMERIEVLETFNEENIRSTITSNYTYIGGLVGYAYCDEPDVENYYNTCFSTVDIKSISSDKKGVSIGGVFGYVQGQSSTGDVKQTIEGEVFTNSTFIEKTGYTGTINVQGANNGIYLGGFAGHIAYTSISQCYSYADIYTFNLKNSTSAGIYAGGFAGYIEQGINFKVATSGELQISTGTNVSLTTRPINLGGFAGVALTEVHTASVATNLSFDSTSTWSLSSKQQVSKILYDLNDTTINTQQNIGGFAGVIGMEGAVNSDQYFNILVTTTIYNLTNLARVDSWAFASDYLPNSDNLNFEYLTVDTYLSNVSGNNFAKYGVNMVDSYDLLTQNWQGRYLVVASGAVIGGTQEKYFYRTESGEVWYPQIQFEGTVDASDPTGTTTDLTGTNFEKYYNYYGRFVGQERGDKMYPILLGAGYNSIETTIQNSANGEYKFYYQMTDWIKDMTNVAPFDFYGYYNGGGTIVKSVTSYDFLFGKTPDYASSTQMGIFNNILNESKNADATKYPYGSVISGVNHMGVSISFTSAVNSDINFGIIVAGTLESKSFVYGCNTAGFIEITKNDTHTANIAGIVNNCEGQLVSCSSSIDFIATGTANFNVGGLVANMSSENIYGLTNCYFSGTILNNAGNAKIGGVVANAEKDGSAIPLYARNVYTTGEITNKNDSAKYNVFVANASSIATSSGDLYYESATLATGDTVLSGINAFYTIQHRSGDLSQRLENNFVGNAWEVRDQYNYAYPVLSYTQCNNYNELLTNTGSGVESNPFMLRNAGAVIWALKYGTKGVYYQLEKDVEYSQISEALTMSNITLNEISFKGNLLGAGYSVLGATDRLMNSVQVDASIDSLGFENVSTANVLLATVNSGNITGCYVDSANNSVSLVQTNNGLIKDCLTEGAKFNTDGAGVLSTSYSSTSSELSNMNTYDKCFENSLDMDFYRIWSFIPLNTSPTASISSITGKVFLRAFIDDWLSTDLSTEIFNEYQNAVVSVDSTTGRTTVSNLRVTSVKSLTRISQYINRNSSVEFRYEITLDSTSYNFEGKRFEPIGAGISNLDMIVQGNDAIIYNAVFDDVNNYGITGMFGRLSFSSQIENITFNNISVNSSGNAAVLSSVNLGKVTGVTVKNSWISSTEDNTGGLIALNSGGFVKDCVVESCYIDSLKGNVGGLIGQNVGNSSVEESLVGDSATVDTTYNKVLNSAINKFASLSREISVATWDNMVNIGGFVGLHQDYTSGAITNETIIQNAIVDNTSVVGYQKVGGFAGYSNQEINGVEIKTSNGTLVTNGVSTLTKSGYTSEQIGGVCGYSSGYIVSASVGVGVYAPNANKVGGLIGYNEGSQVSKSSITQGVSLEGNDYVGGLVGLDENGIIGYDSSTNKNTISNGVIIIANNNYVGGLVGNAKGTSINYADITGLSTKTVKVSGNNLVGGIVGHDENAIINQIAVSYIDVTGSGNYISGGIGQTTTTKFTNSTIANANITATSETANYVGGVAGEATKQTSIEYYISNVIIDYSSVNATAGKTEYVAGFVGKLGSIIEPSTGTSRARVVNVNVNEQSEYVGGFVGYNNGTINNSYAEYGRTVNASYQESKLVGGYSWIGGFVGYNNGTINNSTVSNTLMNVNANGIYIGGFVGENALNATIDGSSNNNGNANNALTINAHHWIGGFVGYNKGQISDATVQDTSIIGKYYIGGFAGYNTGTITSSIISDMQTNSGSVTAQGDTSTAEFTWNAYAGGFVGYNDGTVSNSRLNYLASVIGRQAGSSSATEHMGYLKYIGGFAGFNNGVLNTVYSAVAGDIKGYEYVGGIAGQNDGTITATGNTSTADLSDWTVNASGTIKAQGVIGGITGYNNGTVEHCYSKASANIKGVLLDSTYEWAKSITGSTELYDNDNCSVNTYVVGGIVGYNANKVDHVESATNITAGSMIGGVIGVNAKTATRISIAAVSPDVTITAYGAYFVDTLYWDIATKPAPDWLVINHTINDDNSVYDNFYSKANGANGVLFNATSFTSWVRNDANPKAGILLGISTLIGIQNSTANSTFTNRNYAVITTVANFIDITYNLWVEDENRGRHMGNQEEGAVCGSYEYLS